MERDACIVSNWTIFLMTLAVVISGEAGIQDMAYLRTHV